MLGGGTRTEQVITMRRKWYAIPLLVLAVLLVAGGGFGTTQAALSVQSNPHLTRIETENLSTELLEAGLDGKAVAREGKGDLLRDLADLNGRGEFRLGQRYPRALSVRNDGDLPEYVRVTVYRYWADGSGRRVDLSPEFVDIGFDESSGWHRDGEASSPERVVMWYERALAPGEESPAFTDAMALDTRVATEYAKYDGLQFHVEAVVDAVQTHNAADAMRSAWGHAYDITESEGK